MLLSWTVCVLGWRRLDWAAHQNIYCTPATFTAELLSVYLPFSHCKPLQDRNLFTYFCIQFSVYCMAHGRHLMNVSRCVLGLGAFLAPNGGILNSLNFIEKQKCHFIFVTRFVRFQSAFSHSSHLILKYAVRDASIFVTPKGTNWTKV